MYSSSLVHTPDVAKTDFVSSDLQFIDRRQLREWGLPRSLQIHAEYSPLVRNMKGLEFRNVSFPR